MKNHYVNCFRLCGAEDEGNFISALETWNYMTKDYPLTLYYHTDPDPDVLVNTRISLSKARSMTQGLGLIPRMVL